MNNKGRTTDAEFWKSLYSGPTSSWDHYYGGSWYGGEGSGNGYGSSKPSKKEHKFSPILLVFSTVFNCEHCNRKKEDCKYNYCDDEDSPPTFDTGGW